MEFNILEYYSCQESWDIIFKIVTIPDSSTINLQIVFMKLKTNERICLSESFNYKKCARLMFCATVDISKIPLCITVKRNQTNYFREVMSVGRKFPIPCKNQKNIWFEIDVSMTAKIFIWLNMVLLMNYLLIIVVKIIDFHQDICLIYQWWVLA